MNRFPHCVMPWISLEGLRKHSSAICPERGGPSVVRAVGRGVLVLTALLLASFHSPRLSGQVARTWVEPTGSRVLVAGQMDSFLLQPSSVDMGRNIVVLFDRGDESLKAVDRATGRLQWELGRSGQGPWEFAGVTDIAMGPANSVWVLDADNRRVYIVGPDGSHGRVINIVLALAASEAPYRMAVLPDGFVLGLSSTDNGLAAVFSAD